MNRHDDDEMVRNAGTWLALFGLLTFAVGLFLVLIMVLPQMAGILVVLLVFVLLVGVNYAIWGWWYTELGDDEEQPGESRVEESRPDARR